MTLAYKKLFSIREIEEHTILQWVFGATIFSYFLAFDQWMRSAALTTDAVARGAHVCRPYFQSCGDWYFLRALPEGYTQNIFYMALFATLVASVYFLARKDWVKAHAALLPSFLWHGTGVFLLSDIFVANYEYYLFFFAFILLFFSHKEFFLKLTVVFFYFLSTAAKLHESWILGTYFSALKTGLPLFPDWSIPFWTNLVIFMEMIGAWFLLSSRPLLQRGALAFFVAFHLYSGLFVWFRYPATVLPTILILFGPMYRKTPVPLDRRAIPGWLLIIAFFFAQLTPLMIPGDEKLTLEGNKYGLFMFEANHQCVSSTRVVRANGESAESRLEGISARDRCDPYWFWFRLQTRCKERGVERIEWTLDHSINGSPFLRIVDEQNACALSYKPFSHNAWIKTEKDNPVIIGYPVENIYE